MVVSGQKGTGFVSLVPHGTSGIDTMPLSALAGAFVPPVVNNN